MYIAPLQKLLVLLLVTGSLVAGSVCRCQGHVAGDGETQSCEEGQRSCCPTAGQDAREDAPTSGERPCQCPECRSVAAPQAAAEKEKISAPVLLPLSPIARPVSPLPETLPTVRHSDNHFSSLGGERTLLALSCALNN